jgi:serine O-acetyltransferase
MRFREVKYLIRSDLYRHGGKTGVWAFLKAFLRTPGFKCSLFLRLCNYLRQKVIWRYSLYLLARLILHRYTIKYGIVISEKVKIGSGFYIGHFGNIIVNDMVTIGKNCNISQGVTIGKANRGKREGYPTIGDNVYIAPGAKIAGNIRVGNNVAIGANCVVIDDVPDNGVVVGVPGKVVSFRGSEGYINYTDYGP